MFDNIGGKIKTVATAFTFIGIAVSLIAGLVLFGFEKVGSGILVILFGSLFSWLGSLTWYGFGEIIELMQENANNTKKFADLAVAEALSKAGDTKNNSALQQKICASIIEDFQEKLEVNEDFDGENIAAPDECPCCFNIISATDIECSYCGYKLKK